MNWDTVAAIINHKVVQGAFAGMVAAIRRDIQAFKLAPPPREFNIKRFLRSAGEGALMGAVAGAGIDWVV